ncbi:laminin subunit alpha-4-like [Ylistrum balloti]|uniref:laminin subunit alpha-4-like n=1 Tax=Ylistrum balloti TaxID=509963 RepID=UPI002905F45F|nr:laminin subunit alpha-4-like [Ylistrum balloti]
MHTCVSSMFQLVTTLYLSVLHLSYLTQALPLDRCKSAISIFSSSGAYIESLNKSRVALPVLQKGFTTGHEMKFEFKTTSPNGVLFYMTPERRQNELVALDIINGHPRYHIRCKQIEATLTLSRIRVDDGRWHKIVFRRRNNRGKLFVDRSPYFHDYRVDCGAFTSLTFGGVDPNRKYSNLHRELNTKHGHFLGCIRRVDVSTGVEESRAQYQGVSECS